MKIYHLILLFLFYSTLGLGADHHSPALVISPQIALPIGIKIWFNECGGDIMGLTTWNDGEEFASLGIGHFLWHPYPSKNASFNSGFPRLLRYIEARGTLLPEWLQGEQGLYCPWRNRNEFLKYKYSPKMQELRNFLQQTIPIQAEYLATHLRLTAPRLIASAPVEERHIIHRNFYGLASTPMGIYALIDFLNFKGAGISNAPNNYKHGSGLLQVLRGMQFAPSNFTLLQSYVWSAKKALIRRTERANASPYVERWLAGWFKRLNTYLGEV